MKSVLLLLAERRYLAQQVVCSFHHKNHGPPQFSGVHLSLPLLLFPFFWALMLSQHKKWQKGWFSAKWSLKNRPTHPAIVKHTLPFSNSIA